MRPAVLDLATRVLSGGIGQGVQLFEEPLDLALGAGVVLLQLSFCHLLLAFVVSSIIIATDKTRRWDQCLHLLCDHV